MVVLVFDKDSYAAYVLSPNLIISKGLIKGDLDGLVALKRGIELGNVVEVKPGTKLPRIDSFYTVSLEEISVEI